MEEVNISALKRRIKNNLISTVTGAPVTTGEAKTGGWKF